MVCSRTLSSTAPVARRRSKERAVPSVFRRRASLTAWSDRALGEADLYPTMSRCACGGREGSGAAGAARTVGARRPDTVRAATAAASTRADRRGERCTGTCLHGVGQAPPPAGSSRLRCAHAGAPGRGRRCVPADHGAGDSTPCAVVHGGGGTRCSQRAAARSSGRVEGTARLPPQGRRSEDPLTYCADPATRCESPWWSTWLAKARCVRTRAQQEAAREPPYAGALFEHPRPRTPQRPAARPTRRRTAGRSYATAPRVHG